MIYFSRIGSSIGSTSFSTDSIKNGRPFSSGNLRSSLSLGLVKVEMQPPNSNSSGSFLLIQLIAYVCGSIMRQYLDDLDTMIPF